MATIRKPAAKKAAVKVSPKVGKDMKKMAPRKANGGARRKG
jgi:hypothetical protein